MDNTCHTKSCKWLVLAVIVAGFASIYQLLASRLPDNSSLCPVEKELALQDKGNLVSFTRTGNDLHLLLSNPEDGVSYAYTVDACSNKITSKVVVKTK